MSSNTNISLSIPEAPPSSAQTPPLTWLRNQAQAWRDTIADYEKELVQLQADIAAARVNLEACDRLLSLHEPEAIEQPTETELTELTSGAA